ncbi:unnamed protein product [Fraxinus pennsylvanica]|uniref:Reverse transcriptase domain-containing protein n=1 Tax=Fraxinus pennsylvanica TaxID=56036 RepID=A0AAD2DUS0_9LAMI|nr:unnamed protein product [Fraxinus pennsylvanica]
MSLRGASPCLKCRAFHLSLGGTVEVSKEGDALIQCLQDMRQAGGETLKNYIARFTDEITYCEQVTDKLRLSMIDHRNKVAQRQIGREPTSLIMSQQWTQAGHTVAPTSGQALATTTLNAVPTLAYENLGPNTSNLTRNTGRPSTSRNRGRAGRPRNRPQEVWPYCTIYRYYGHDTSECRGQICLQEIPVTPEISVIRITIRGEAPSKRCCKCALPTLRRPVAGNRLKCTLRQYDSQRQNYLGYRNGSLASGGTSLHGVPNCCSPIRLSRNFGKSRSEGTMAVTSIYYLCMKFSTERGIATIRGDQMGSRECYLNSLRKSEPRVNMVLDAEMSEAPEEGQPPIQDIVMAEARPEVPLEELDPRVIESESQIAPMEEVETFPVDHQDTLKVLQVRKALEEEAEEDGIECRKVRGPEKRGGETCSNGFVREANYPKWISNPVLVKKHNSKWMVCINFSNLNQVCPKDSFQLPRINQLVDSIIGHELLSFMDSYSGYNQMPMFPSDEENTSFIIDEGLYCYKLGKTMEVYVDVMLVKSLLAKEHIGHLAKAFHTLRKYHMRLNPLKCAFGVASGKFLGYIINQRGIEANPKKIKALIEMRSPQKPKEVQRLIDRIAALNRFISRATEEVPMDLGVRKCFLRVEKLPGTNTSPQQT